MSDYPLMVTISGIRGIAGKSLTPSCVEKYVAAFGMLQKGKKIIIGRDSRVSGPWVLRLVTGILCAQGYELVDCGIVPTPTVQFMVQQEKADGGIVITSSHNPVQWNGLKFVDSDGLFLKPDLCTKLFEIADAGNFEYNDYSGTGSFTDASNASQRHIDFIFGLDYIKPEEVAAKKYKVVLDSVNGAGGPIMKALLEQMGCEVVGLNLEPTGVFAHTPEPVPQNLGDLCAAVPANGADLGIAVDPDVDRCVLIDETGKPLGEEYTLSLAVEFMLGKVGKRGPVCKNLSTTRAVDDIAAKYGCETIGTPVGEIQVAKKMVEVGSQIGGEGNGGVMLTDVHIGRDAPVAAALTLQHLASFGGKLSELKASLPQWEIVKLKTPIKGLDPDAILAHFKAEWADKGKVNDADGVRIDTENWWVHLRKSNTEPIMRVIGEGANLEESTKVCERFMAEIQNFGK